MGKILIVYFTIVLAGIIACALLGTTDDNLGNGRKRPFLLIPIIVWVIQLMGCVHFYIFSFVSEIYGHYNLLLAFVFPIIFNLISTKIGYMIRKGNLLQKNN